MKPVLIYVVAVDVGPIQWAVNCELCDDIVSEATSNGEIADIYEYEHRKMHNHWDHWDGFSESNE